MFQKTYKNIKNDFLRFLTKECPSLQVMEMNWLIMSESCVSQTIQLLNFIKKNDDHKLLSKYFCHVLEIPSET